VANRTRSLRPSIAALISCLPLLIGLSAIILLAITQLTLILALLLPKDPLQRMSRLYYALALSTVSASAQRAKIFPYSKYRNYRLSVGPLKGFLT
jgi:hypothetical protein